jgi:excisionase family DNA binding protein
MSRSLPNRTFFSISQVSIAVGVSADTLRRLEAKGKIKPKRGSGKRRLYSLDDVTLLKQILNKPDQTKSFTIQQAADILTISVDTLRRWERKGKIKSMRTPGGHRRFSFEAIEKVKETKYKPVSKSKSPVIKKVIQPELKPVDKPQPKPILTTPRPEYKQAYFNLSLIAFVIVSTFMISIVRLSAMVIKQADELAKQADIQKLSLKGQVLGVETGGGSAVTLARVLDSDFNLSVNGYVEGSVLRSTSTSDAPLVVANDTKVENLNADLLDGKDWTDLPDLITEGSSDIYDFSEFKDNMALDASTNIALGSLTLSTSGTGALDFNSTGQVSFAGNVDAENGLDVTGSIIASGDLTVTGGDITLGTTSIFSGGDSTSLNNIDSIDSTTEGTFESALDFLRSDDSDSYTSGTLSFSDGTFLDLSAIIHNDSALQGIRLPQNTSFTSLTSGEGFIAWDTDDNKLQVFDGSTWTDVSAGGGSSAFSAITSGTNTSAAMEVGTGASLTYSGTGTITASDLTCTDCLDFTEFANSMTLDETTDIALGSLTLSTSGTGALDFNSTGQVSFASNVNAENGLDVTTADLTVGGANFSVAPGTGNITSAGVLDINGAGTSDIAGTLNLSGNTLTSTGDLTINPSGGDVILSDGDVFIIGGHAAGGGYNVIADSGDTKDEAAIAADNDLYIGGDLEVDGTIYGTVSGGAGSLAWDDLTAPDANLSLGMSTFTTTFNWATGTSTDNLFSFTTDASANGTGSLVNIQTGASATVLPLRVRAGAVEAIAADAAGKIGIGITNPDGTLHVHTATAGTITPKTYADDFVIETNTHGGMTILTPASSGAYFAFGSPTYGEFYAGLITTQSSTNLSIKSGGATRAEWGSSALDFAAAYGLTTPVDTDLTLSNTGTGDIILSPGSQVGIGTTSPEEKLTVIGNVQLGITDATRYVLFDDGDASSNPGIRFETTTDKVQFSHDGTTWNDMSTGGGGSSWWGEALGVLSPVNATLDLAVGGTATASAKFYASAATGNITTAGDIAVNGGDITTTATTLNIDVGDTGTINFRDGTNTFVAISDQGTTGRLAVSDSLQVGSTSTLAYSRFGTGTTDHSGNFTLSRW